jgi:hypothetical protein
MWLDEALIGPILETSRAMGRRRCGRSRIRSAAPARRQPRARVGRGLGTRVGPSVLRGILEEVGFAPDSPLEETRFETFGPSSAAFLRYQPKCEKIIRLHSPTAVIESGFVHLPETAPWLAEYLHELTVFPNGKHDDQVDSTAQFLEWLQRPFPSQGFFEFMRRQAEAAEHHRKPQPIQTVWAIASMEWLAEQKKSR